MDKSDFNVPLCCFHHSAVLHFHVHVKTERSEIEKEYTEQNGNVLYGKNGQSAVTASQAA